MYTLVFTAPRTRTPIFHVTKHSAEAPIPRNSRFRRFFASINCDGDTSKPITIFDPNATWKKQTLENVYAVPVLEQVFAGGKSLYTPLSLQQLQNYCLEQVDHLWEEVKRFENPHRYYVDLSLRLWQMKRDLLEKVNTF